MKKRGLNLPPERTFTGPATVWKRLFALIIDLMIIYLTILFPFERIIQNGMPKFSSYSEAYQFLISNQGYTKTLTIISAVMSIFAILYFAILEFKIQQTPGKLLMRIEVVSDAKELTFWQCMVRSLFLIPVFPFFLLLVIDPLFLLFTKTHQRLSEILSKTKTVEKYMLG